MTNSNLPDWAATLVGLLPPGLQPHGVLIYAVIAALAFVATTVFALLAQRANAKKKEEEAKAAHFISEKARKEAADVNKPLARLVSDADEALQRADKIVNPQLRELAIKRIMSELSPGLTNSAEESQVKKDVTALVVSAESEERRALALIAENKLEEAAALLIKEARTVSKESAERFARIGRLFFHRGVASAIDAFETASKLDPTDIDSRVRLAKLYARVGRTRDARIGLEEAVLDAERPVDRAEAQVALAERLFWAGGVNEANSAAEKAIEAASELAAKGERSALEQLSFAYMIAGRVSLKRGDSSIAVERMKSAQKVARTLKETGNDADARLRLSEVLVRGSEAFIHTNKRDVALAMTEEGVREAREVLAQRKTPEAQRALGIALLYAGDALAALSRQKDAIDTWMEALELGRQRSAEDSGDSLVKRELMVIHTKLADCAQENGDSAMLLEHLKEAAKIADSRATADPNDSEAQRDLALALGRISSFHFDQGNLPTAKGAIEEALRIHRARAEVDPESKTPVGDLAATLAQLGDILISSDVEGARAAFEESLAYGRRLPHGEDAVRRVVVTLTSLGELSFQQGEREVARVRLGEAIQTARQYLADCPSANTCRENLAYALMQLGLGEEPHDKPKAVTLMREAAGILGDLCVADPSSPRYPDVKRWYDEQLRRVTAGA